VITYNEQNITDHYNTASMSQSLTKPTGCHVSCHQNGRRAIAEFCRNKK